MVNMGEVFAHRRIPDMQMERVPVSDKECRDNLLEAGDLLFARQSSVLEGAGKCSVFLGSSGPVTFESHLIRARLNRKIADPRFYFYFFQSRQGRNAIKSITEQVAAAGIRGSDLARLKVPKPCLEHQRAVAATLSVLDDKIELNRRVNETLEAMARAIFKSWFVDFDPVRAKAEGRQPFGMDPKTPPFFPDSFQTSSIGKIPRGWKVGRLDELVLLQRGFDLPTSKRTPGPYPVLSASGPSGTHAEYKVKGPGITTGRSGLLGKVFFVHEDFWPLNTSLWVKEFRGARPVYAFHLLRDLDFDLFNAGSAVPTLNRNHVHGLPVVVPPIGVVETFEELVGPMYQKSYRNEQESRTLAALRDALLPKLISGEIRVKDAEQIVERAV